MTFRGRSSQKIYTSTHPESESNLKGSACRLCQEREGFCLGVRAVLQVSDNRMKGSIASRKALAKVSLKGEWIGSARQNDRMSLEIPVPWLFNEILM